jgi:polyhydroxybutyrate depolymerase
MLFMAVGAPALSAATPAAAATGVKAAAVPSPGCEQGMVVPAQRTLLFSAAGDDGSYLEQAPATGATGRPLPVVFDFHGYQETGASQEVVTGLGSYGQSHGFVTVTPWINSEPVPRWLSVVGSRDLAWFGQLLTHVEETACVDQNRLFVTGYSNGAFMSSAIACEYSARVAAVAPVAGLQAVSPCTRNRPVPVVAFHGTGDPLVHYDGTPSKKALDLTAPDGSHRALSPEEERQFGAKGIFTKGPTVAQQAATWARRNGCSSPGTSTTVTGDTTRLRWSCPHHADVELYRIAGGGHTWPGSQVLAATGSSALGRTTLTISADALMWEFFVAHPRTASD